MPGQPLPRDIIGAAAQRLAGFCSAIREAHDDHGVEPGPHDDLTAAPFHEAAGRILHDSLSADYIRRTSLTFGAVSALMQFTETVAPAVAANPKWQQVVEYFTTSAELHTPNYKAELDQLPSLVLATQSSPAVIRFDLLAAEASRVGVLRLFDAASWVAEVAPTLPTLDDGDLDPVDLAALAATSSTP